MILGINHIQITIPVGMEVKAKEFYCELLGIKEIEKPDNLKINGGFWLQLGEIQIHVGVESNIDRTKTKAHIAYEVTDINKWYLKLQSESIVLLEKTKISGFERFECRDPFGNKVEFISNLG